MDVNEEERTKGKTVEVGRAAFNLDRVRYTILDAPGHKGFVPEMLSGASQADVGVLIISARKGEFEAGFERGGQTREHALLAKTLGVNTLIVAVNKMDESTVLWDQTRYDTICRKLGETLESDSLHPCMHTYPHVCFLQPRISNRVDFTQHATFIMSQYRDFLESTLRNMSATKTVPYTIQRGHGETTCDA